MVVCVYSVSQLEDNLASGILYFGLFRGQSIFVLHVPNMVLDLSVLIEFGLVFFGKGDLKFLSFW